MINNVLNRKSVRNVLKCWYKLGILEKSELISLNIVNRQLISNNVIGLNSGVALKDVFVKAIERLKPMKGVQARFYRAIYGQYIERKSTSDMADEFGISLSSYNICIRDAIDALVDILIDMEVKSEYSEEMPSLVDVKVVPSNDGRFNNSPFNNGAVFGRELDINNIISLLTAERDFESEGKMVLVRGWPGVGKTTIASCVANSSISESYFKDGVLWVSLDSNPDIFGSLLSWIRFLGYSSNGIKTVSDASLFLSNMLREKTILVVIDDVWHAEHIIPFLVGSKTSSVLITTRMIRVADDLSISTKYVYFLDGLEEIDALNLMAYLVPSVVLEHREKTIELLDSLERLPLAIHVSGKLLKRESRGGYDISQLISELNDISRMLNEHVPANITGLWQQTRPTVVALLKKSTDKLTDPLRKYFSMLGFSAPKPAKFDLSLMSSVWMLNDPRPIASELVDRGLLENIPGGKYQMHALLVAHAESMLIIPT
ncbi:MAG TPA: NB-ARC domain-containing protein [Roseiflexaceae bacterium]|nr:NB-ARC domain-containing protein [Roseiflexaceae bacterium]